MSNSVDTLRTPLNFNIKDQLIIRKACEKPLSFKPRLLQEQNVFVTRSGIGMKNFKLLEGTIPKYPGKRRHFFKYALINFFLRKKIKLSKPVLLVHNHWSSGYYHWLGEAVPRLMLAEERLKDCPLLLPENYPSFAVESLKMFGVKEVFRIPVKQNLQIEHLIIPENPPYTAVFYREAIVNLRERAHAFILKNKENEINLGEKIYVYRGRSESRNVSNSIEVKSFLEKKGFAIIDFEDYNFWQQVSIMYHARIFISVHGAGLTNQIFMKEKGYVYEFQKEVYAGEEYSSTYYRLTQVLNHNYLYQFCPPENIKDSIYKANIHVDLKELEKNLAIVPN